MPLFSTILFAALASASPLNSALLTKQALSSVPEGWQRENAAAPADHKLDLHIRLREENLDRLQQRLLEISDPGHPEYRKHLSKDELDAMTAPTKNTVDSVTQWLASNGIAAGKIQSGYMKVSLTVEQANKALGADYAVYKQGTTGRQVVRTTSYSLPKDVYDAIAMIQPTTLFSDLGASTKGSKVVNLSNVKQPAKVAAAPASCSNGVSTQCLRDNYNIKGYTPSNTTTLGIAGFLEEVPNLDDLSLYVQDYDSDLPSALPVSIVSVNNGPTAAGGEGEADLDAQIAVPLSYPINILYTSTGGRPPIVGSQKNDNEPYLEWLQYVIALKNPPQTFSVSYIDEEFSVPADYADSVCSQFMKLGARGVSVFIAAGDHGAGDTNSSCKNGVVKKFSPLFPASCPWVTTVGGTYGFGADEQSDHDGGSGFSNRFAAPSYQTTAVNGYIKTLNGKFDGLYNKTGRAYPDVAALYETYPVYRNGEKKGYVGTSAAAPAVASVIALINDYLVSNGKAPLGFLNPWLYKTGKQGFRDIAKGHNNVCANKAAFPAVEGWDATTGWGVPDFGKLKKLVL
ncbi:hypothetical protein VHEMI06150 [[Torrubiella] hemipterigena]|uniref:tripeptidyl-peptidase II n=1 Tax=[Torrubiella] hemipterigena TaxID=1531966 RepID=A0A0A1SZU5_9HYPO|nr:hypothetical protein VHEMI06150 [[Torrubiella] hemipterigena]